MDRYGTSAHSDSGSPPSEAWLFAQAILGRPIRSASTAEADARAEREQLEWLAQISSKHQLQLRRLQSAEVEARRERKQLDWLATISEDHKRKLHALLWEEAEAREAHERWEWFTEARIAQEAWDPSKHPRRGGPPNAGWWATTGGSGGSGGGLDRPGSTNEPTGAGHHDATPAMLELAHAWWQTKSALRQSRREIEELPKRIANEQAQLGSGGRYAHIHTQNLAKAQQDLEAAKALVPQLEKQLSDLEQQYHESGYDEVPYSTWTPGETLVGGRGIEDVGRAVAMGGSPAGLKPTGIEVDVALTVASIFQLGRSALGKASTAAPREVAGQAATLKPYGGPGGGHHVPAKSAFEGAAGYDAKAALAFPNEELAKWNVRHFAVTGAQKRLYREFAKTGATITWEDVERIEIEALVQGGLQSDVARATVKQAIEALKKAGVSGPTRIPWGN